MLRILRMGGLTTGGLNFDAKRRRESHEPIDLFHAHIGGMDAFARGLQIADAILRDGRLDEALRQRYRSWDTVIGRKIEKRKMSLIELDEYARGIRSPKLESGRQEMLENLINEYIR
jgi:xylose isomerase